MSENKLYEHKCQRCGGLLDKLSGGEYRCTSCGRMWKDVTLNKYKEVFDACDEALRRQRQEDVAHLHSLLWKTVNERDVYNRKVEELCGKILEYVPDDFYANFYLATCGRKKGALSEFLSAVDIDSYYDDIPDMLDYLLKSLKLEWALSVDDFIERAYKDNDLRLYREYRTRFEAEKAKLDDGVFEPTRKREVFIAYSSADMPRVESLVSVLEDEGLNCFVAARNLRHGSGAVDNYENAIHTAIDHCKVLVFVSSDKSRQYICDACKELNYIDSNHPDMPRVEFLIKNYSNRPSEGFFKDFFEGIEYCYKEEDVAARVCKLLMSSGKKNEKEKNQEEAKPDAKTERKNLLARAKMYSAERRYDEASEIYNQLKERNPDDMDAYIGLVRVASENFTLYDDDDVDEAVRIATDMFGKQRLLHDHDFKQFFDDRNKYLKSLQSRGKSARAERERSPRTRRDNRDRSKSRFSNSRFVRWWGDLDGSGKKSAIIIFALAVLLIVAFAVLLVLGITSQNIFDNLYLLYSIMATGIGAVMVVLLILCKIFNVPHAGQLFYFLMIGGGIASIAVATINVEAYSIVSAFLSAGLGVPTIIFALLFPADEFPEKDGLLVLSGINILITVVSFIYILYS